MKNKKSILVICSLLSTLAFAFLIGQAKAQEFPSPDKLQYPPLHFELPRAERVVLDNGIVLYILENHELPLVNVNALFKTGTMYDPEGKAGAAEMTAYVMRTGGTLKTNSAEFDKQIDLIAASASVSMSLESAQVSFSCLKQDLDRGFDLLSQMIIDPAFEENKFELAKQLKSEELRRIKDDPQRLAFREFNHLIYSKDPRGNLLSQKSLTNIQRTDLVEFHNRFFLPGNAMFAVSGDITRAEAVNKFSQFFGQWKPAVLSANLPAPSGISNPGVYIIHKDIPQSTIVTGKWAPAKNSPDFYDFTILDFIVGGGGFPSRIVNVVRNNEGLAYSAGSFYRARTQYGIFGCYAFTKTSSTMKTLSLINSILENLTSRPITVREMDWAKKSIDNGFIFSFATPEQIVWQQMNVEYEKLPPDFLTRYRDKIKDVPLEGINKAAAQYLEKTKNVILILGDSKNFDQPATADNHFITITPEE